MCSGKSTVGKLLADKLGYTFWDIDQVIEEREGKSIEEIFKSKGEEYFRSLKEVCWRSFWKRKRLWLARVEDLARTLLLWKK